MCLGAENDSIQVQRSGGERSGETQHLSDICLLSEDQTVSLLCTDTLMLLMFLSYLSGDSSLEHLSYQENQ